MGKTSTVPKRDITSLLPNEISDFQSITSFPEDVLIKLHNHYRYFSTIQTDDGVIDYGEFVQMIHKDRNMTRRIFNAIDTNKDGVINFREFIRYISCFVNGSLEERIKLSFRLFADEQSKMIKKETMIQLLTDIIMQGSKICQEFFGKDEIKFLVHQSFNSLVKNPTHKGKENIDEENKEISFEEYKAIVEKNQNILNWLKIDLEKIRSAKFEISKPAIIKTNTCFG